MTGTARRTSSTGTSAAISMRVALVAGRYAPHTGGVELVVEQVAVHLAAAGHQVTVLTQDHTRTGEVTDPRGFTVRRFRLPSRWPHDLVAPGLVTWLARHAKDVDVIHAHGYHTLVPPAVMAAAAGRSPVVVTGHYHGSGHSPARARALAAYRPLGAAMLGRAAAVVCVSAAERDLVAEHFPAVADRTVVVPNGVEPASSNDTDRDNSGLGASRTLLTVGRLERYKRVDVAIDALAYLPDDVTLTAIGDGPARAELEAHAAATGLSHRVRFLGRVNNVELAARRADAGVYVSLSAREAFGLTLAEALAAGLPAVASDLDSHREVAAMAAGPGGTLDAAGVALVPVRADEPLSAAFADPVRVAAAALRLFEAPAPVRVPLPTWAEVADAHVRVYARAVGCGSVQTRTARAEPVLSPAPSLRPRPEVTS